jgi:hypothetical protein
LTVPLKSVALTRGTEGRRRLERVCGRNETRWLAVQLGKAVLDQPALERVFPDELFGSPGADRAVLAP